MVFNDTATKLGLIQDCEQKLFGDDGYGQISGNANRLYRFTQLLNFAANDATGLILGADTKWQFDDTNYTDYPIGTTNIVANQRDYELSVNHLKTLKVQIKDQSGLWTVLPPFDESDVGARPYLENNTTQNTGTPRRYDKFGTAIWLDPIPDYSSTGGLRIYYQRPPSLFTHTDTTKTPGFASIYHEYLSLYASLQYAKDKTMNDKINTYSQDLQAMQEKIVEFYSKRNKDEISQIIPHNESSR